MAHIHRTTMTPGKLELLTGWLPKQSWYLNTAAPPELVKAGGFRLDDPEGEVGIEFMVVADTTPREPVAYLVPMTYRGAPLTDAPHDALIGTSEHGVLGRRWIYDALHDPVATTQLHALLRAEATPQHQSESDTPDPTVTVHRPLTDDPFEIRLTRVLRPLDPSAESPGSLTAGWTWPDGTTTRGVFATAARQDTPPQG
ncbi:hypothetical protein GCM10009677_05960 [Sphaerisporangium rubeum]|uniref:Maltokinase N-terminal cap domain-containing protein n=1 Tax=Sphaerisporangium rubeum TaxID=321317 RepID=A0A7X0M9J8_9ACTN|nr:1,4-alpha-glucan branching protein [Sphaerisporangium rubeum]MBB6476973.1 hypothetical protein [Sphaerisporangium rubeum]